MESVMELDAEIAETSDTIALQGLG